MGTQVQRGSRVTEIAFGELHGLAGHLHGHLPQIEPSPDDDRSASHPVALRLTEHATGVSYWAPVSRGASGAFGIRPAATGFSIEVVFADGTTMSVDPNFAPAVLKEIVSSLEVLGT